MKRFFTYCDIMLDKRGVYTPSHTIIVPKLAGKVEVFDEAKLKISTPESLLNLGYIDVIDETCNDDVSLLFGLPNMHGIQEIDSVTAKQMLLDNNYIENSPNIITIIAGHTNDIGEIVPELTIDFN